MTRALREPERETELNQNQFVFLLLESEYIFETLDPLNPEPDF